MAIMSYIAEMILRAEAGWEPGKADKYAVECGLQITGGFVVCSKLLDLLDASSDEVARDISAKLRRPPSRYWKLTRNQLGRLVDVLLTEHSTARRTYAAAYGVTEEVLMASAED